MIKKVPYVHVGSIYSAAYICNIGAIIHLVKSNISYIHTITLTRTYKYYSNLFVLAFKQTYLCMLLQMVLGVQWTHVFLSLNPHRFHEHVPIFLFLVRPHYIFHIFISTLLFFFCSHSRSPPTALGLFSLSLMELSTLN